MKNAQGLNAMTAPDGVKSSFAFGLAKPGDAVAWLPLTAFLEQFQALKAFEDVSFADQSGGGAQTAML